MKKSFANQEAPLLVAVIKERTPAEAIRSVREAEAHGATAFDLHLSCLDSEYQTVECIRSIVDATDKPMLGLNYNLKIESGIYECPEEERVALLKMASEAGIAGVDIQSYTYNLNVKNGYIGDPSFSFASANPKEVVTDEETVNKQKELIGWFHDHGTEVLLSNHPLVPMTAEQIIDLNKWVAERNPDVIKMVTWANTEEDVAECVKAMALLPTVIRGPKVHLHASGPKGRITRLVNPLLGSHIIFCVDQYKEGHDPNQLPLETTSRIMELSKQFMNKPSEGGNA